MKLKRPSGANDYDTLADIEGEGGVSPNTHHKSPDLGFVRLTRLQSQHGTPQSLSPPQADASAGAELDVKPVPNLKKRKSSAYLGGGSVSDGEEHPSSPAKRPYHTLPAGRRSASPRKSLKSFNASSPGSTENAPPLPVRPFDRNHHLSPTPNAGPESRVQLGPMTSSEVNGVSGPPTTAPAPAGGFTAVNTSFTAVNTPPPPPAREPSSEAPRTSSLDSKMISPTQNRVEPRPEPRAYTSPYDTAAHGVTLPSITPDPRSVPALSAASTPAQGFYAINSSTPGNGVVSREHSVAQGPQQAHITPQSTPQLQPQPQGSPQSQVAQVQARSESQPHTHTPSRTHVQLHQQQVPGQPPSRTQTPNVYQAGRSIAPHPASRSNTPFAHEAHLHSIKPQAQQIAPAPAPAPTELHAPIHGMRIVPAVVPAGHAQAVHPPPHVAAPVQPSQPVLKSQHVEVAPPPQPQPRAGPTAAAVVDLRLLQCEVLALLVQYLFPRPGSSPDEGVVLNKVHALWYHGEALFHAEFGPDYDLCSRILVAWLHERAAISSLRHSLIAQPGVSAAGLMDRLLAMNDLRVMRLKWKNMSTIDGVSPEDLLCKTFAVMSNTANTDHVFKDGLDRLNRDVFEFLRHEDAKIVMHRR